MPLISFEDIECAAVQIDVIRKCIPTVTAIVACVRLYYWAVRVQF